MRKMGLQKRLHNHIKDYRGYMMPYLVLEYVCRSVNQKNATGERRLRGAGNEDIETMFNIKGHIKGYRWTKD